jgi:hypothetical protein
VGEGWAIGVTVAVGLAAATVAVASSSVRSSRTMVGVGSALPGAVQPVNTSKVSKTKVVQIFIVISLY